MGRLRRRRPARPHERTHADKVKQGIAEVKEGKTFCLSMPLDYPGGNVLNPRRHPPQIRPSVSGDKPNWHYRTEWENPGMTDVINDDVVIMHLQYSTQWDTLAHVGALFDADGDGKPEPVFYNGYRGGIDLVGPTDAKDAGAVPGTFVEAKGTSCANALGVENMAAKCLQGRAVMIDYKSGKNVDSYKVGWWKSKNRFQAALYMLVVERLLGLRAAGGVYMPLGSAKGPRGMVAKDAEQELRVGLCQERSPGGR